MPEPSELPPEEQARLRELAALDLLSVDADAELEQITAEAAAELDLPIALVSVITDSAQVFAASHGLEGWLSVVRGTPKAWSFCQHAVDRKAVFVVEDAATDDRVKHSPLVSQDGIRCYLGVPLLSSRGNALGTLCVIGAHPRTFTPAEQAVVEGLAARAVQRIEARAASAP